MRKIVAIISVMLVGVVTLSAQSLGYAYIDGQDMDIVFDCNKLYNFLTKLGSKVSALGGIMKITESYDGMILGFSLSK